MTHIVMVPSAGVPTVGVTVMPGMSKVLYLTNTIKSRFSSFFPPFSPFFLFFQLVFEKGNSMLSLKDGDIRRQTDRLFQIGWSTTHTSVLCRGRGVTYENAGIADRQRE